MVKAITRWKKIVCETASVSCQIVGKVDDNRVDKLSKATPPPMIDASRRTRGLQFTRDGKSVVYAMRENGVDTIWMQPLDGSAGHRGGAVVHALAFWSCG
jgi:hypothetical protein